MKYCLSILLALLCGISLVAAPRAKSAKQPKQPVFPADFPKKFTARETKWIETALSQEYLLQQTAAIAGNFLQKKNYSLAEVEFDIQKLKEFSQYYFMESDSGLSRRWIAQNIVFAEALKKAKSAINSCIINQKTNTEEYRKWYNYYMTTAKQYIAISKKPIKMQDKKKIARLNKLKKTVLEQMQQKEAAENAKQPTLDAKKLKKNRK